MGCDIHLYVEERLSDPERWTNADRWQTDEGEIHRVDYYDRYYSGRNYDLFAILANVRNRDGFIPIDLPRGLPPDVSQPVRRLSEDWGVDAHSHSYLSLRELLEADWSKSNNQTGIISSGEWVRWRLRGSRRPESYAQGVGGRNVVHVSSEDMDKLLKIDDNDLSHQDRMRIVEKKFSYLLPRRVVGHQR